MSLMNLFGMHVGKVTKRGGILENVTIVFSLEQTQKCLLTSWKNKSNEKLPKKLEFYACIAIGNGHFYYDTRFADKSMVDYRIGRFVFINVVDEYGVLWNFRLQDILWQSNKMMKVVIYEEVL